MSDTGTLEEELEEPIKIIVFPAERRSPDEGFLTFFSLEITSTFGGLCSLFVFWEMQDSSQM